MKSLAVQLPEDGALHARPADLLVRAARGFRSRVGLRHGDASADAKEIVQVLLLGAPGGARVTLEVEGDDEAVCAAVLESVLSTSPPQTRLQRRRVQGRAWLAHDRAAATGKTVVGLEDAVRLLSREIDRLEADMSRSGDPRLAGIPRVQRSLLETELLPTLRNADTISVDSIYDAGEALARRFEATTSIESRAKARDVRDLSHRLCHHLRGAHPSAPPGAGPWIWVTERLDAAALVDAKERNVVGVVTRDLAPTAHAWLLARGLGLPVRVVQENELRGIEEGESLTIVDDAVASDARPTGAPRRIAVRANVGSSIEALDAFGLGAEGIGLVRTELLFAGHRAAPDAAAQRVRYAPLLLPFGENPIVFRLFDAAKDKPLPFLGSAAEGSGAARLAAYPDVLTSQLDALLGLARERKLELLAPLVESPGALMALSQGRTDLGAMIESETGARAAREIAAVAAFVSIGTNDLSSSVLRKPRERVTPEDALERAVWYHLEAVIGAAQAEGKPVSICGEAATVPEVLDRLVSLGVDAVSVSPQRWGAVAAYVEEK